MERKSAGVAHFGPTFAPFTFTASGGVVSQRNSDEIAFTVPSGGLDRYVDDLV